MKVDFLKSTPLVGFIFLLILTVGVLFSYIKALAPVDTSLTTGKFFIIAPGEGLSSISRRLKESGLIRNKAVFLLQVRYMGLSHQIQAGGFRLSPSQGLREIIKDLTVGKADVWITIIPGMRAEQVGLRLKGKLSSFVPSWLEKLSEKEGYLWPDSYLIPQGATLEEFLAIISKNYQQKVTGEIGKKVIRKNLSEKELIILASLVEREAKFFKDRQAVAGVLLNRLQQDWPLQIDATVQYALANNRCGKGTFSPDCQWWPIVSPQDLKEIKSPYNTYFYKGLPPAPICNPSLDSLKAVLEFVDSDYWYYISDDEGRIHLSKTIKDHQANIRQYLK